MMLASGTSYKITNVKGGTVLDLSGGDNKSIIGYNDHDGSNQRWIFTHQRNGWTLQSVGTGLYLGIDGAPRDGAPVIATQEPTTHWEIDNDGEDSNTWRFYVQGTEFNLDLSDHGNPTPGTPITLWGKWSGKNQTWRCLRLYKAAYPVHSLSIHKLERHPPRIMVQLQSGQIYKFTNVVGETVIDLSGGDNRSIIGYGDHNGPNQRWIFDKTDSGWTIKSAGSGQFLGLDREPENGVQVVAIGTPFSWEIKEDSEDKSVYRVFVPGTKYNLDLADHGNKTPGTPVTVWGHWHGKNQTWRIAAEQ
ncbi:hypothetical protein HWV62_12586 [Athelia sp. TMB]|nr:hypothetical protein HWV62_12586 [Athelia sp. TMB]